MDAFVKNQKPTSTGKFSHLLRHWRRQRRLSQLELAGEANVSARHLSFLESGRSKPSREMVQLLGMTLDLPLEERNVLHVAAGFVPPYGNREQAPENIPHVRQALDFMLRQQEPYPAIVIDGHWDIRLRNDATKRMFSVFRQAYDVEPAIADNAMHTVFHPKALRQFIVNWEEFAGGMIQILHREVAQGSRVSAQLLDEIMVYPGLSVFSKPARAPDGIIAGHDHAASERLPPARLFFHLHDVRDARRRRFAAVENRVLLSGRRRHRRDSTETRSLTNTGQDNGLHSGIHPVT